MSVPSSTGRFLVPLLVVVVLLLQPAATQANLPVKTDGPSGGMYECGDHECSYETLSIEGPATLICSGFFSCSNLVVEKVGDAPVDIVCSGYFSCIVANVTLSGGSLSCSGESSCSYIEHDKNIPTKCTGIYSCTRLTTGYPRSDTTTCSGDCLLFDKDTSTDGKKHSVSARTSMISSLRLFGIEALNFYIAGAVGEIIIFVQDNKAHSADHYQQSLDQALRKEVFVVSETPIELFGDHVIRSSTTANWIEATVNAGSIASTSIATYLNTVTFPQPGIINLTGGLPSEFLATYDSIPRNLLMGIIQQQTQEYFRYLFGVPSECLTVTATTPDINGDPLSVEMTLETPDNSGCAPPSPFYGSCCINGEYFSSFSSVELPDLLMTLTPLHQSGELKVKHTDFTFGEETTAFIEGTFISDGSYIDIGSEAAFSVSGDVVITDSTVSVASHSLFQTDGSLDLGEGSQLIVSSSLSVGSLQVHGGEVFINGEVPLGDYVLLFESTSTFTSTPSVYHQSDPNTPCQLDIREEGSLSKMFAFCGSGEGVGGGDGSSAAPIIGAAGGALFLVLVLAGGFIFWKRREREHALDKKLDLKYVNMNLMEREV